MRRTRFFMIAVLALCAATTAAQEPSPEERLAAEEAKWSANKPKVYEFSLKLIACCVIRLTGPDAEPIVFLVENGVGSLTALWAVRPPSQCRFGEVQHHPKTIRSYPGRIGDSSNIEYDRDLGYPRRFYIKRFENAAAADYTITIEGFSVLAR